MASKIHTRLSDVASKKFCDHFYLELECQQKDSLKSTSNSYFSAGSFVIYPPAKREENDIVVSGILKERIRAL